MESARWRLVVRGMLAGSIALLLCLVSWPVIYFVYNFVSSYWGDPAWSRFIQIQVAVPAVATCVGLLGAEYFVKEFLRPVAFWTFSLGLFMLGVANLMYSWSYYLARGRADEWDEIFISVIVNVPAALIAAYLMMRRKDD